MSSSFTRLRRLRATPALRRLVAETALQPHQLIQPIFVTPGSGRPTPIATLPGIFHHPVDCVVARARELAERGIGGVLLFGAPTKKDAHGSDAWSATGAVQQACRALREAVPELVIMTDVCLCAYTEHGHCGVLQGTRNQESASPSPNLSPTGRGACFSLPAIDNDRSIELLAKIAVSHAHAGAQIVAPSDMMDGRVAAIRAGLDAEGFRDVAIMSYAAKFASALYGPFRGAQDSKPVAGDRQSYQMDPRNAREAIREVLADVAEGADIVMVKPASLYLDIIHAVRAATLLPIAAYQVSGEYAMITQAGIAGLLDADAAMLESLIAIRRAGADLIITYAAADVAAQLCT